jgi:hypothetical protein
MIATTIEQSKHLLSLGLDPKTADMSYTYFDRGEPILDLTPYMLNSRMAIPAWSLSALLDVMPNNDYWEICLLQYKDQQWQCVFDDVEFSSGETKGFTSKDPLTAAYEMVCWLLTNNLITKGGKDGNEQED